jgi:TolB-like protein/predicted Zn-dependent protease
LRLSLPASPAAREPEEPGPAIATTRARWLHHPFQRLRRVGSVQLQVSIALLLAGMLASWAGGLIPVVSATPKPAVAKAVAVLPFRTIGPEDDGQFISEAMHQEVLTQLTRARALRVIALGSVADLRIDMEDNRAVAEQLGAEYLIRGALQATGNRIRIWARLVDAATDEQLWASSFEGDRDDLFRIQLAVAAEIADALEARFPVEGTGPGASPTESAAAYEAYLKARLHSVRIVNRDDARRAATHLEEAVRLDPGFANAWAVLSYAKLILAYAFAEHEELERAEEALRRAEALAPDDVETWLAEAYFHSYASQDYDRALARLRQILEARPSHAEAMALQGFVQRRKGMWEEAAASMTAALELDPSSYSTTVVLAEMYMRMRRFAAAERLLDRAIAISPAGELAYVQKALLYLNGRGDAAAASALLRQVQLSPKHHGLPALAALFANDPAAAYDLLMEHSDSGEVGRSAEELIMLGLVHRLRGEQDRAAAWADSIRGYLDRGPQAAELASASGGVWPLANAHGYAAVAFALSGRNEEAVANAERAVGWLPLSRDAYAGTEVLEHLAEVYALIGRTEAAVETLGQLLSVPSRITPHVIRLHPVYRSMKGDPAFEALLQRYPAGR